MLRKYALSPFDERRTPRAGVVAASGLLDLDHARPHVAEQHRAVRTRQHAREVEHRQSVERRLIEGTYNCRMAADIIVYTGSH